jgi:hypothetical protein
VALVITPFLFGFSDVASARNFFIAERPLRRMGMGNRRIHA